MTTYLHQTLFNFYCSGIYEGKIEFREDTIMHSAVDSRQRTQMKENVLTTMEKYNFPFHKVHKLLEAYATANWMGDSVVLDSGDTYQKHLQYTAHVAGNPKTSHVWALRNDTALDVVTVEGEVAAFVFPNRYGMEILVREGFEQLTPLVVYDDPLLSTPDYGINDLGTFLVPMRDGVRLATDVLLPEGIRTSKKLPTILVRTCYDRNGKKPFFARWANKGYAVVCQDVRGRADSEGELVPFYYERDDSSDTIDWICSQPWSNSVVGMWGASYLGYVVVAAATSGHPNLKAVVDEVNVGSPFVDTVRRGGTLCSWPLLSWTLAQSVGNRTDFDVFAGITVNPEKAVDARPISDIPQKMIGRHSDPWDLWSSHPEYDDFWRNCTFSERGHQVKAPIFVISGWFDGDSPGVAETWRMLSKHDIPNRKILLGPWEHGPNRAREYQGASFSNDAVVYDYDVTVLKWFDRFLKDIPNGIDEEPRAKYYVMGENQWRTSDDWTPVEAKLTRLYLASNGRANSRHGDGTLLQIPPKVSPEDTFIYNPKDPVTDSGERELENLRTLELRNDILVYTTDTLRNDVTVAGELSAEIYASTSGVDTDWAVSLSDVDEQGNSIRLSSYILRAKYRNGFDKPALVTPGKIEKYAIYMQNIAYRFQQGHKIRFTITSSSKFTSFPNPNTGQNPYEDNGPITVTQKIYHTTEFPSCVVLPLLDQEM